MGGPGAAAMEVVVLLLQHVRLRARDLLSCPRCVQRWSVMEVDTWREVQRGEQVRNRTESLRLLQRC